MTRYRAFFVAVAIVPLSSFAGAPGCIGYTLDAPQSRQYRAFEGPSAPTSPIHAGKTLTAADIDNDGFQDVVAAGANGIDILFGDGTGKFADQLHVSDGPVDDVAIADLNGDGLPDIVAISQNPSGVVNLFRNRGRRTFGAAERVSEAIVSLVTAGDFTNDGRTDLLLLGTDTRLLVNEGDARFNEKILPSIRGPQAVAPGDFDGDGHLDFVVATLFQNGVSLAIYKNDGNGSFVVADSRPSNFPALAVADLNGDGRDDVIALSPAAQALFIFTHGLTDESIVQFDIAPAAVITGDFNHDGRIDVAVIPRSVTSDVKVPAAVRVLLNDGTEHFSSPVQVPVNGYVAGAAAADFDGDGNLDLALNSDDYFTYSVSMARGKGDGTFRTFERLDVAPPTGYSLAADLNGDGVDEIVGTRITGYDPSAGWASEIAILRNNGGRFVREHVADVPILPRALVTGDIDADGRREIAVAGFAGAIIFKESADGSWIEQSRYDTGAWIEDATFIDIDGDHRDDLAFVTSSGPEPPRLVIVSPARGGVTVFSAPMSPPPRRLIASDVNGDGIADLVVTSWGSGSRIIELPPPNDGYLSVFIGRGDGSFGPELRLIDGQNFDSVYAGDFDGDGNADIVVRRFLWAGLSARVNETLILRGDGRGHFGSAERVEALSGVFVVGLQADDIDGDRVLELIATTNDSVRVVKFDRGGRDHQVEYAGTGGAVLIVRTGRDTIPSVIVTESGYGSLALFPGVCSRSRAVRRR